MYMITKLSNEYNIGGTLIPKESYTEDERRVYGKKNYAVLTDKQYEALTANSFFNELLANGQVTVSDEAPEWALSESEQLAKLKEETSKKGTSAIKEELAQVKKERDERVEAVKTLQQTYDDLKASFDSGKAEYDIAIAELNKLKEEYAAMQDKAAAKK